MNDRLVESFCDLVRVDSESGDEARFQEHLKVRLERELHATCTLDAYGNLVARLPAVGSKKTEPILLGAHADTVKPGKGIVPIVEDGVVHTDGTTILGADDKAAIAEIMEALRTAARRPPVEVLVTRSEEIGTLGARNLDLSLVRSKIGFIVDTEELDQVTIGGPSRVTLDFEVIGKAAHAAEPEKGISAIRVAAEAITAFQEGRLDPETVANVGTIQGGTIRNGIPERVTIQAECRSHSHEKCLAQVERMKAAFEKAASRVGARVEVTENLEFRASRASEDSFLVQVAMAAIRDAGLTPRAKAILGGTDALVLQGRGIQAVVLGMGGANIHSTDEEITAAALAKATEILRRLLESLA
jgi:tripeptide aminopeptidase